MYNDLQDSLIVKPVLEKLITKCRLTDKTREELLFGRITQPLLLDPPNYNPLFPFRNNRINKSWVEFDLVMQNIGSADLENWNFKIIFTEGVARLDDGDIFFRHLSLLLS